MANRGRSKLNPLEAYRNELYTILHGAVMAERMACARIAAAQDDDKAWTVGKRISRLILDRPPFQLPPLALGLKDVVIAVLEQQKVKKKK